jgi:hypothetical protein
MGILAPRSRPGCTFDATGEELFRERKKNENGEIGVARFAGADWSLSELKGRVRGMTRGDVLRYAIAFALRRARKIVRGLKEALTEAERAHRRSSRPNPRLRAAGFRIVDWPGRAPPGSSSK